jgi:hypothetical protein
VHFALGLRPQQGSARSAKRSSCENRGEEIPSDAGGLPAKFGQPTAVGWRENGLGVNPVDGDPDLGRRVVGGSPWRARSGDGGRVEGCTGERVGRLSLARLVSTSELGRRYWRGRWGRRSTRGGGRRWLVKWRKRWSVKLAPGPEVLGASSSGVLRAEGKVGSSSSVRTTTMVGERW